LNVSPVSYQDEEIVDGAAVAVAGTATAAVAPTTAAATAKRILIGELHVQ
jgi:hypothetical protein